LWRRLGFQHAAWRRGSLLVFLGLAVGGAAAQTMTGPAPIHATDSRPAAPLFGAYIGFPVAWTPAQTLRQTGFQAEFGVRVRPRYFVGFDVSRIEGTASLGLSQTPAALANPLRAEIAELEAVGILPPGYQFQLSGDVANLMLGVGPQFTTQVHHRMMFFGNPDLGAMRASLTPKPHDAFTRAFVATTAPSGGKVDWTPFYGGSGGIDVQVGHHFGIRGMLDVIHSHPFHDLLADGVWSYRLSMGVSYEFGRRGRSY
jgi:hypothetical protein